MKNAKELLKEFTAEHLKDELLNRNWLPRGDSLYKRVPFCYDLLA